MEALYSINPLSNEDLQKIPLEHYAGITLDHVLDNGGLTEEYSDKVQVFVNGVRHYTPWKKNRLLAENDVITIFTEAHGGQGLRMAAMIALVVAVSVFFPPGGAIAGSTMLNSFAAAGFMMAGTMLINALLPPPVPPVPDDLSPAQQFAIASGSNRGRLGQPMPLVIGKHKFALDLAASPYPSYEGGDNYYYGIYHAGLCPEALITNLSVGNTLISTYPDTVVEFSGSDGIIDLFPANVDTTTVSTQFTSEGTVLTQTTSIDTTQIAVDYTYTVFHINSKGKASHSGFRVDMEYSPTGQNNWQPLNGVDANVVIQGSSTTPQRKSMVKNVPKGQYDVRLTRPAWSAPGAGTADFTWNYLRSFQPDLDTSIYENQRRIAVKYKATNNLNGRLEQVNAEISNKTLTWNGSTWSATPQETSNPAAWFLHLARGLYNSQGTRMYGLGIPDSLISLAQIQEWSEWCDTNNLEINFVFTQQMTAADALALICRVGRATISFHDGGKLGIVYDNDNATPIWVCNPSNMIDGSFQMNYMAGKLTDGCKVNFADETLEYKDNYVQVNLNGVDDPLQLNTVRIPGITKESQAAKEANLILAESQYHLRTISFDMDIEGQVLYRGAVIHVTSNIVTWADSGRLLAGSTQTSLNLSHPVDATGTGKYILVRFPDGEMEIVPVDTGGASDSTLTLSQSLVNDPAAYNAEDIIFQYEQDATPGGLFKITDLTYSNHGKTASIMAQDYDSAYYAAQHGGWQANTPNVPVYVATISNIEMYEEVTTQGQTRVVLLWDIHNGIGTELEIRHRAPGTPSNDANYTNVGRLNSTRYEFFTDSPEEVDFILHPVNVNGTTSTPTTFTGTVNASRGTAPAVPNVTGLEIFNQGNNQVFTGNHCKVSWNRVALDTTQIAGETLNGVDEGGDDAHFKDYKVTVYNPAGEEVRTEYTNESYYTFTYEKNSESTGGDPIRAFTFKVWVRGTQNQLSNVPAKLAVSNPAPPAVSGISIDSSSSFAFIEMDIPSDNDYKGVAVWSSTSSGFTPSGIEQGLGNCVYKGQNDAITISGLTPGTTQYFKIAAYDSFGLDDLNYSGEFSVDPTLIEAVDIADDAVGNAQLAADAVEAINIKNGEVTEAKVDTGAITNTKLAALSIDAGKLQANSVVAGKVAADAIGATQIVSNAVTAYKINANAVTAVKINASAVTTDKLNAGAVTAAKIGADQVTATHMATNSITAANAAIANATVNTLQVAGTAITTNGSTALASNTAFFNGNFGTSWSSWGTITSVTVNAGSAGVNVDSFIVLASSFRLQCAMYGGSNSGYVQFEFRVVHSSGSPVSSSISPDYGYEYNAGTKHSPPGITRLSAATVRNGYGSYYFLIPSIQIAPANSATGNVTYYLQGRARKTSGGNIGAVLYAPAGTNIYMGGTKR